MDIAAIQDFQPITEVEPFLTVDKNPPQMIPNRTNHDLCRLLPGLLFVGTWVAVWSVSGIACSQEKKSDIEQVRKFANQYCVDCHQEGGAEGEFDVEQLVERSKFREDYSLWQKLIQKVTDRSMPPEGNDQPAEDERIEATKTVEKLIEKFLCDSKLNPPKPLIRRLNRTEYANTVRDLLGISIDVSSGLPEDGAGGEGFDNAAETLFISPIHAEKYLIAAGKGINHAMKDPRSRRVVLGREQKKDEVAAEYAKVVLRRFLFRAFRRPVSQADIDRYLRLFQWNYQETQSTDQGLSFAMKGALVSPKFLFLTERLYGSSKSNSTDVRYLDDFSIASKLSYFLWASMPDQKLLRLASEGKLRNAKVLKKQVARMIKAKIQGRPKVRDFAESFVSQWLETRRLGREYRPDKKVEPRFDSELLGGMKYEPIFFFEDLVSSDHSILNLIRADYTFVNRRLARHYRVKGEFREQPKRVDLKKGSHRGGVLSMAAVLAVSSYPHRTSPVLRGKYVLETILGQTTPPPPDDVPVLEESKVSSSASLREQLEKHRSNTACASCHNQMDPIGFGLENYDILGRYRTRSKGKKIDNKGVLPDGTKFAGPVELQKVLLKRKDQFARHLTEKLLGYALGRALRPEDRCVAKTISKENAKTGFKIQDLLVRIVLSDLFLKGQAAETQEGLSRE